MNYNLVMRIENVITVRCLVQINTPTQQWLQKHSNVVHFGMVSSRTIFSNTYFKIFVFFVV